MMLTGKARVAGVMGWPVSHSRSPRLHGYWLRHYGIDGAYIPMAVAPDRLGDALRGLPALGMAGCNITVPHKEAAMAFMDAIDPPARRIGAVNTVIVGADGRLEGRNTDGYGFIENLKNGPGDWQSTDGPAVVVGAGGASRAIVVALLDAGVAEVRLCNRTREKAEAVRDDLGRGVTVVDWVSRETALEGAALLVNTTTLGMSGQPPLEMRFDALPKTAMVTDAVYVPLETPLLLDARRRGNPTVDGLGMLLHQGRPGFAAWFGIVPEVTAALRNAVLSD